MIVVDSSIMIAVALDEMSPSHLPIRLSLAISEGTKAIAPAIFVFEFRNALLMSERRKRIGPDAVAMGLAFLLGFGIEVDAVPGPEGADRILALARRHGLTVYDAAYVDPAVRRGATLASLDGAMVRAAAGEGVAVFI